MNIELPEPVAHIYPSDLERFAESETFCTVFSVAVGNAIERSVPLFTEEQLREAVTKATQGTNGP